MNTEEQQFHLNQITSIMSNIEATVEQMDPINFSKEEGVLQQVYQDLQTTGQAAYQLLNSPQKEQLPLSELEALSAFRNARYNVMAEMNHQLVFRIIQDDFPEMRTALVSASAEIGSPA